MYVIKITKQNVAKPNTPNNRPVTLPSFSLKWLQIQVTTGNAIKEYPIPNTKKYRKINCWYFSEYGASSNAENYKMQVNLISVLNPIFLDSLTENIVIIAAGKAIIATGIVLYLCFIEF